MAISVRTSSDARTVPCGMARIASTTSATEGMYRVLAFSLLAFASSRIWNEPGSALTNLLVYFILEAGYLTSVYRE